MFNPDGRLVNGSRGRFHALVILTVFDFDTLNQTLGTGILVPDILQGHEASDESTSHGAVGRFTLGPIVWYLDHLRPTRSVGIAPVLTAVLTTTARADNLLHVRSSQSKSAEKASVGAKVVSVVLSVLLR